MKSGKADPADVPAMTREQIAAECARLAHNYRLGGFAFTAAILARAAEIITKD